MSALLLHRVVPGGKTEAPFFKGGTIMASEVTCIFKRNSKCIFKERFCDQDCDKANWKENHRFHEDLLEECLGGDRKFAFLRKAIGLLLQFR